MLAPGEISLGKFDYSYKLGPVQAWANCIFKFSPREIGLLNI